MEKYGVDTTDTVKVSEDLKAIVRCRNCGSKLESTANVPKCPECGTAPYETEEPRKP